jgi:putative acetyltransferase
MLNIRHATQDDRDAIIAVHIAAVRAIDSHYSKEEIEAFAIPKDPASYEEAIRDKEFYVAENDDQIVGFAILNQPKSEIEAVFSHPAGRGLRVGSTLIKTLEARASALELTKLTLNASLNAVEFYKHCGF